MGPRQLRLRPRGLQPKLQASGTPNRSSQLRSKKISKRKASKSEKKDQKSALALKEAQEREQFCSARIEYAKNSILAEDGLISVGREHTAILASI